MRMLNVLSSVLLLAVLSFGTPSWVQAPAITYDAGQGHWNVSFELSEAADVEVAIVTLRDSTVVRHLAAGVLGPKAPAPFVQNLLSQTLVWDQKDDLGNSVSDTTGISVRVRVGMGVRLDKTIGEDPYSFKGDPNPGFMGYSVNGVAVDQQGMVYVCASENNLGGMAVRQYNREGIYQKTVFPFPAGIPAAEMSDWGINLWGGSSLYSPDIGAPHMPQLTKSVISNSCLLLPKANSRGDLVFWSGIFYHVSDQTVSPAIQTISPDSRITGNGPGLKLVTSRPLPSKWNNGTRQFFCFSDGGDSVVYASGLLDNTIDTGFFRNGQVFRINVNTGVISPWLVLDSLTIKGWPKTDNAIHGLTCDSQGRVYICDRLHGQIGVYDKDARFLGAVKVPFPEWVEVNNATGAIYVLSQHRGASAIEIDLKKYSGFGAQDSLVWRVDNTLGEWWGILQSSSDFGGMAVDFNAPKPLIWAAFLNVKCFRDDGNTATLVRDFNDNKDSRIAQSNKGFERLVVDSRNEIVYFTDTRQLLYKIEDWNNPAIVQCSTATGVLMTTEPFISPDHYLYTDPGSIDRGSVTPVARYTLDHIHAPAPFNNGSNLVAGTDMKDRYGWGNAAKGLAVSRTGQVAYVTFPTDLPAVIKTSDGFSYTIPFAGCGGVRYDSKGNIYVGLQARNPDHAVPAGFESASGYFAVGSVVKFTPESGFTVGDDRWNIDNRPITGALKVYTTGTAGFSGMYECPCRSPRFDVDAFDRLYIPNTVTSSITITDNDGNVILKFGEYGNIDSKGPTVPVAWASCVSASDNYIYLADIVNTRILRVQKTFVLDNMPGLSVAAAIKSRSLPNRLGFNAWPMPFNSVSHFSVSLPRDGYVTLQVYNAAGKLVKTLAQGHAKAGQCTYAWDATDNHSSAVSAGVYLCRLTLDGKIMVRTVMLNR